MVATMAFMIVVPMNPNSNSTSSALEDQYDSAVGIDIADVTCRGYPRLLLCHPLGPLRKGADVGREPSWPQVQGRTWICTGAPDLSRLPGTITRYRR